MGGGGNIGEASDNPVEINVTAMVDVIFCLCIFFMCSFHFKQIEGKIDTWLPDDKGNQSGKVLDKVHLEEIRVFMRYDQATGRTTRKIGSRSPVADDAELISTIQAMKADYDRANKLEVPVLIDSTADVPWHQVVHVVDLCKAQKLSKIEFAEPMEYSARSQSR
jgi:biopolymer transport protein ExbD